jgi:exosortase A
VKPNPEFVPLSVRATTAPGLAALLAAGAVVIGILAAFWPTAVSIEAIWRRSETFAHGYVVLPIVFWLVWRRRDTLATLAPQPFLPALAVVALGGFAWMTGSVAGVLGLQQFALLVMLEGALVAVLGLRIAREIAFALIILVFAVPLGEVLVPWLIDRTADFTVAAVQLSGVPVYREGNHLTIPTGRWSVVEACSGIRYLVASMLAGVLYAHLSYRSMRRRALFILASIIVPIVANWFRAYMIVMLGHLTNNRIAVGVDHIIYGWVFFGVVMVLMFWIGSFWREDEPTAAPAREARWIAAEPYGTARTRPLIVAVAAAILLSAGWLLAERAISGYSHPTVAKLQPPQLTFGWAEARGASPRWNPHFSGASSELHHWYSRNGQVVGLFVALYAGQSQGAELISSQNRLVMPSDDLWVEQSHHRERVQWDGNDFDAVASSISGRDTQLAARSWYWVDGQFTASDYTAKGLLALARLSFRPDHSAVIVLYTPGAGAASSALLDEFARDMGPAVMRSLRQAAGG